MAEMWVSFDLPEKPLNMNNSDGRQARREYVARKLVWKEAAYFATCAAFPEQGPAGRRLPPSDVRVMIPVSGKRVRDPSNWQPTVKVIVDAMVMAGCWEDDNPEFVTQHEAVLVEHTAAEMVRAQVLVRVVPR
jgi:hypothetical protein